MKKYYSNERDGQMDFFTEYAIPWETYPVLVDNCDGVWKGMLFEFKLLVKDLNQVVFQSVKYLSKMRIKGENVPEHFLVVSLNSGEAFLYRSSDYYDDIHKVYFGGASKCNHGFVGKPAVRRYDLFCPGDVTDLMALMKDSGYIAVELDENCIVGWAERYYAENPHATKGDFLGDSTGQVKIVGEIREPKHFRGLIVPYKGRSNERFKYLMDKLNDRLNRRELGAFYTPPEYCAKAVELVRRAVERVPEGNDYVIIDRCAGSGNLEELLPADILSHCILSTYEYYEYKVLFERLHDRVRFIVPPNEGLVVFRSGFVDNANALTKEYIGNKEIRRYVNDPSCTVILLENPPYRDDLAENGSVRRSYVFEEFVKDLPQYPNPNISTARDILNQFVWSARKWYLRQESDSYVLFCPAKAWKTLGLLDLHFGGGFLFNRKHFHASASSVMCCLWENVPESVESIGLEAWDIQVDRSLCYLGMKTLKKAHTTLEPLFDRTSKLTDSVWNVYCETDGTQTTGRKCDGKSYTGEDIIGYLRTDSFGIDPKHVSLTRCTLYNIRGFYLRKDNLLRLLPLYAAKRFPQDVWYEKDVFVSSADGGTAYAEDRAFLQSCFIFACLHSQNKCRSFYAMDGGNRHLLLNELCFDKGTFASAFLERMTLDADEEQLLVVYRRVLENAALTAGYRQEFAYGVFQVSEELNTFHEEDGVRKPDYVVLNSDLVLLKDLVRCYYDTHVRPGLFRYGLLK